MSKIKVCALFRPLNQKERADHGDSICIHRVDSESFIFKDEKEDFNFSFDRVFYPGSPQSDVYDFIALPLVQAAVDGINGAIITYGQTGAGKTYTMEGPSIMDGDEKNKGLLPKVVNGLFEAIALSDETASSMIKLSMVEIYMEKVRDLFELVNDNIQIKENRQQGIFLYGATEINVTNCTEALQSLCNGIANRAVGETQMNMASSRSHCIYMFTVQQEITKTRRMKSGKLILVDLAGSEKVEKTGAEGRVLEEAKSINKSLSALGNVINALTGGSPGKSNHVPYRDSKLTRILQDVFGGKSQTALLCCCSPSPSNAPESLSTLRFGARAKHIKASIRVNSSEDIIAKKHEAMSLNKDELRERILNKLKENFKAEDVDLLEQLFILDDFFFDPGSVEEVEAAYEDITVRTISLLQKAVEDLNSKVEELTEQNAILKAKLRATEMSYPLHKEAKGSASFLSGTFGINLWVPSFFHVTN
ncbi:kinesin-like protein KIN-1 [Coffea eugenioides]|uniref:kinesin-like protein KIN-1 n=1 Tax=Coffea eugenioides TaxID=49369 RepID=UPI000F610FBD|nr:kinesin-like protein KIN-1 [Coffea eugenioides]